MIHQILQAVTLTSDWDALTGCISNPNSVDFSDDVNDAMYGHAVVVDSNDETKKSNSCK